MAPATPARPVRRAIHVRDEFSRTTGRAGGPYASIPSASIRPARADPYSGRLLTFLPI